MITINVAKEYTKVPGGRYINEGPYSGEEFRERILKPAFLEANKNQDNLVVILDGGYGYATSFLEEAFGGLAREVKDENLINIKIISDEEPDIVNKIKEYIKAGLKN